MAQNGSKKTPAGPRLRRFCRRAIRYVRLTDAIHALLLLIACILSWIALEELPAWVGGLMTAYISLVIIGFVLSFKERSQVDKLQGEVLWGLCDLLNAEIFGGSSSTRFTLFRQDVVCRHHIVPWYRYQQGGQDAISDADASLAEYRKNEGVTGRAWANAKDSKMYFFVLPRFEDRKAFEEYYTQSLNIRPNVASVISDYMTDVGTIFSIGYTDSRSKFLAVLSIDLEMPWELQRDESGDSRMVFDGGDSGQLIIRSDKLHFIAETIRNVLRSFSQT